MSTARRRDLWGAVSSILAQQANLHRNTKRRSKPYRPAEFDPTQPPPPKLKATVAQACAALGVKPRPKRRRDPDVPS